MTAPSRVMLSMANSQILAQTDRPGQSGRGAVPRPTGTGRTYANRSVIGGKQQFRREMSFTS